MIEDDSVAEQVFVDQLLLELTRSDQWTYNCSWLLRARPDQLMKSIIDNNQWQSMVIDNNYVIDTGNRWPIDGQQNCFLIAINYYQLSSIRIDYHRFHTFWEIKREIFYRRNTVKWDYITITNLSMEDMVEKPSKASDKIHTTFYYSSDLFLIFSLASGLTMWSNRYPAHL